jgi:hypothetical protein
MQTFYQKTSEQAVELNKKKAIPVAEELNYIFTKQNLQKKTNNFLNTVLERENSELKHIQSRIYFLCC